MDDQSRECKQSTEINPEQLTAMSVNRRMMGRHRVHFAVDHATQSLKRMCSTMTTTMNCLPQMVKSVYQCVSLCLHYVVDIYMPTCVFYL